MWGVGFSYGDGFGGLWTANGNGGNARGGALSFGGKLMGKIYSTSKQGDLIDFGVTVSKSLCTLDIWALYIKSSQCGMQEIFESTGKYRDGLQIANMDKMTVSLSV
ncbi:hypothetical protein Tco_0939446 [Tanacetum coccineum]|uniref:Uncharacterized protein n=1 Tax=Tanacetum coccineum TaxID=301880 RepID=A0ABQ5DK36_9ASTR